MTCDEVKYEGGWSYVIMFTEILIFFFPEYSLEIDIPTQKTKFSLDAGYEMGFFCEMLLCEYDCGGADSFIVTCK